MNEQKIETPIRDCQYDERIEELIHQDYIKNLPEQRTLSNIPFVGINYARKNSKVFILGESHYHFEDNKIELGDGDMEQTKWAIETLGINRVENNRTYNTLVSLLLPGNHIDFFKGIAFNNLVARFMNYNHKEQATWSDCYYGWKGWLDTVRILKPDYCLCIGVRGSNSFNCAMRDLKQAGQYENFEFEEVSASDKKIGNVIPKRASISIDGHRIELVWIRHTSSFFSTSLWQKYLAENMPGLLEVCQKLAREPFDEFKVRSSHKFNSLGNGNFKPFFVASYDYLPVEEYKDALFIGFGQSSPDGYLAAKIYRKNSVDNISRISQMIPFERILVISKFFIDCIIKLPSEKIDSDPELAFLEREIAAQNDELAYYMETVSSLLEKISYDNTLAVEHSSCPIELNDQQIPRGRKHTPIYSLNVSLSPEYQAGDDLEFISLGHSTWSSNNASVKIFRKSNYSWSPMGEDLPMHRLMHLLITCICSVGYANNLELKEEELTNPLRLISYGSSTERIRPLLQQALTPNVVGLLNYIKTHSMKAADLLKS